MNKEELAKLAAEQCSSESTTAHHGGGENRPFWNVEASQFMYVPAFQFHPLQKYKKYRYTATDEKGGVHTFEGETAHELLTPIWADLPEGPVELVCHGLDKDGNAKVLVGARTFMRLSPFTADLPERKCSYTDAAKKAFDYAMSQTFIQHWITDGTPDPDYDLYVYPSKMVSSIINAMVDCAKVEPDRAEEALQIAKNAADYVIGLTPGDDSPVRGLPPTYQIDFRPEPEKRHNACAAERLHTIMMIYPAHMGYAYLKLEEATGEKRYLDAAERIAEFYRDNVKEDGSWTVIMSYDTAEPLTTDSCEPLEIIVPFLMSLYKRTGDETWKKLSDGAIEYVEKGKLMTYHWGAQFEDSYLSENYSNMTHYGACALIRYYCEYFSDDEEKMAKADDLMRFVEDQFVVWKRPTPWNKMFDTSVWVTPCGLEQYAWYMPIDASTSDILSTFLAMYKAGRGELHLEKAKALADTLTRVQLDSGLIPTHWMDEKSKNGDAFWINCMFMATRALTNLGLFLGE